MAHTIEAPQEVRQLFICPYCPNGRLAWDYKAVSPRGLMQADVSCQSCARRYSMDDGVLDFLGTDSTEIITPFQRLMQFPPIAAIYEQYWRPLGFFIASLSSFRQFSAKIVDWVDPSNRSVILDLACGPGLLTRPIARRSKGLIIGVDLSKPMLRRAQRRALADGLENIFWVRASAFRLPFAANLFDMVLCSGALHLFDQPHLALVEVRRVLAASGDFICQTTLKPKHSAGFASFLQKFIRFGFFTSPIELEAKLAAVGIMIVDSWSRRIIYMFRAQRMETRRS